MISFLLVFLNKSEVYCLCKKLLLNDFNDPDPSKLRFIFRFTLDDNKKIVHSFLESFPFITKNLGKKLINKFSTIGFKFDKLIEDMFYNMFYGYFNFIVLQRVILLYLNEGMKTFYRVTYALLKLCINEIMDCSNQAEIYSIIKQKGRSLKDFDSFFNNAFSLKVTRYNNKFNEVKIEEIDKRKKSLHCNYYIPSLSGGESKILLDEDILKLWRIFPENLKMKDAKMIFSTCINGFELSNLYDICKDPEN